MYAMPVKQLLQNIKMTKIDVHELKKNKHITRQYHCLKIEYH